MQSSLERRLNALEGKPRAYQSAAEMPDDVLLDMLRPLCGGRIPTADELKAIEAGFFNGGNEQHAKP